jgi:thioesterase domain-containing protein
MEAGGEPLELLEFLNDVRGLEGLDQVAPLPPVEAPVTLDALLEREDVRAALPPDLDAARVRELFATFAANRRALRSYRPGPYGGRLTLIRAEQTAAQFSVDGWSGLAGRGTEVHLLPGDHYALLRAPGVAQLGELIEAFVRRALAGSAP